MFTVRQRFGAEPILDCFYKVQTPDGMTPDQMKMWSILDPRWEKKNMKADTDAFRGMDLRLRFNSDMFQGVCMVRTEEKLTDTDLEMVIQGKHNTNELMEWLKEAKI